jgi:hypothetical protein
VARTLQADYLVVGAGAFGMGFTDALTQHSDARVVLVDRRHGPGGHWLEAYPFVRLHQSSCFYGVASTLLGGAALQTSGPEAGLQERASQPEITAYYAEVLDRMVDSGRVELMSHSEFDGHRTVTSSTTGERFEVPESCRIVNAHYLAPSIPAEVPPPFAVGDGARVLPVNDLARLEEAPSQLVVVGSGKTATDAIVWLLAHGTDPGAICWVRPRDPWMLDRARVQPDPAVFLGLAADIMRSVASSSSIDDAFLRMEDAGAVMRIDRSLTPTMAKTPTLAQWELDELRTVEDVVRLGHVRSVSRGRLDLADGSVRIADDALVVHCAADGLKTPPIVPIWQPAEITIQPVRAGFPCLGAALVGYVEATRGDDAEKNRVCRPSTYGNSAQQWASMNLLGTRNAQAFAAEPDIKEWVDGLALNPTRVPAGHPGSATLDEARATLAEYTAPALAKLAAYS